MMMIVSGCIFHEFNTYFCTIGLMPNPKLIKSASGIKYVTNMLSPFMISINPFALLSIEISCTTIDVDQS